MEPAFPAWASAICAPDLPPRSPAPSQLAVKLAVDSSKMVKEMETPAELDFSRFEGKLEPEILAAVKAIAETELATAQAALAEGTEFAELEKEVQDAFNGQDGLLELAKTEETQAEAGMANVVEGMKKLAVDIESVKGVTIAEILEREPEMRAEIEEELKNNVWAP